jgi:hypothetical protein
MRVSFLAWATVVGLVVSPVYADDPKVSGSAETAGLTKLVEGKKVAVMTIHNGTEQSTHYFAQATLANEDRTLVERENKKVAERMAERAKKLAGGGIVFAGLRQPLEVPEEIPLEQAYMMGLIPDGSPPAQGAIYRAQPGFNDVLVSPYSRPESIPAFPYATSSLASQLGMLGIVEPADGQQRNRRSLFIFVIRDAQPTANYLGQMRRMVADIRE